MKPCCIVSFATKGIRDNFRLAEEGETHRCVACGSTFRMTSGVWKAEVVVDRAAALRNSFPPDLKEDEMIALLRRQSLSLITVIKEQSEILLKEMSKENVVKWRALGFRPRGGAIDREGTPRYFESTETNSSDQLADIGEMLHRASSVAVIVLFDGIYIMPDTRMESPAIMCHMATAKGFYGSHAVPYQIHSEPEPHIAYGDIISEDNTQAGAVTLYNPYANIFPKPVSFRAALEGGDRHVQVKDVTVVAVNPGDTSRDIAERIATQLGNGVTAANKPVLPGRKKGKKPTIN